MMNIATPDSILGVLGQWRCEWIEAALQLVAKQSEDEQQQLKEEQQRSAVNGTGTANSTAVDSLHHLSLLPHRSDWRCVSYCNCGRLQAQRLDPFTYQEANWDFYNSLESTCCNKVNIRNFTGMFWGSPRTDGCGLLCRPGIKPWRLGSHANAITIAN